MQLVGWTHHHQLCNGLCATVHHSLKVCGSCGGRASVGAEPARGRSSKLYNVFDPATMDHCIQLATREQVWP